MDKIWSLQSAPYVVEVLNSLQYLYYLNYTSVSLLFMNYYEHYLLFNRHLI